MKRLFQAFCGLLVLSSVLTSCLSSDDETSTYNDTAIEAFKLGTLNRYLHTTTKSGKDSVYKATYSASAFKMNIDQLNRRIFSTDSLPIGTDIAHIICTVTTTNNGQVLLKSMTSDSLFYFNSGADSVNFTQPRVFRVISSDGTASVDYTVSIGARQQNANVFQWQTADVKDFPERPEYVPEISAREAGLTYLGDSYVESYAMSADGYIMETEDNGKSWHRDSLDTDYQLLPVKSMACVTWELDILTDYILLVGQGRTPGKAMTIWRKLADYDMDGKWVYMPLADNNPYYLPLLDYVELVYYNKSVLAFGSDKNIYVSRDQGITWKKYSTYTYPAGFTATTGYKVAVDEKDFLWIKDPASGKAWKGKLSK